MEYLVELLPLLPYALLLACPLMMLFCFWRMRRMGCSTEESASSTNAAASAATVQDLTSAEQVAALQAQLAELQAEQAAIASQLAELAAESSVPASGAGDGIAPGVPERPSAPLRVHTTIRS